MSDDLQAAVGKSRALVRTPYPWWLRPFLAKGVAAITLGRRIYVAGGIENVEALLQHELVHVQQIARLGVLTFYWRYIAEYIGNRRNGMSRSDAYRKISFEVEAFDAEKNL